MDMDTRQMRHESIVGKNWKSFEEFDQRGKRAVTMCDRDLFESNETMVPSRCRRVILHLDEDNLRDDGTPEREEFFRIATREKALVDRLADQSLNARLSARRVEEGKVEMVFHVDDIDAFDEVVAEWMVDAPAELVELRTSWGFDYFERQIRSVVECDDAVRTTQPMRTAI